MTLKIVPIDESFDVADTLRKIADEIDNGAFEGKTATLILDSREVFHFGINVADSRAAEATCFDCNFAIAYMMNAIMEKINGR